MAEKTIHLKRTSLYASGASPVNMIQAIFYNEDMLIYDLEDSVPADEKDAARFLVYNMVKNHRPKDKYVCIRVNGIYSEYLEEDLQAAVRANPDCIRIPKVEYAREVQDISRRIAAIEEKIGLEVFYARNAVLMACRSAGIDALDIVFSDINDKEGLEEDTALAKNLGFDGKTCIHPRQIDTVNSFFTPSMKEIKYALRVLQAVEEGKKQHKGAVTLDGGMIDKPMELRALTTLAQAKAAGIRTEGMVI